MKFTAHILVLESVIQNVGHQISNPSSRSQHASTSSSYLCASE